MIKARMVPLESVLKDVYFLVRESDISEDFVMEFAIRGMEHMAVYHTYEKAVCILRVENNQAPYPHGTYGIEGVLYKKDIALPDTELVLTATTDIEVSEGPSSTLSLDNKSVSCKVANYRHIISGAANIGWQYLPLSNNTFDRGVICDSIKTNPSNCTIENTPIDDYCLSSCSDYYIPDNANHRFITSFDEGWIMVAYYRFPQNDKGQFMVPDHPLYNEALETYVLHKLYQRMWHLSKQGAQNKYQHYLQKWQELSAAATGELMMLSLPDYINLDKQNKFFRDDSPLKVFGGYGKEQIELNNPRDGRNGYNYRTKPFY